MTDEFYSALRYWQYTKLWGLAHGGEGWANEPIPYIDAITALESESNSIENEEMDKKTKASSKDAQALKSAKAGRLSSQGE